MDKRSGGILATVLTVVFCGIPGFCFICSAVLVPFGVIDQPGMDRNALTLALVLLGCLGLIGLIVPIVVGIVTLRRKPAAIITPEDNEPIPPPN
jgi:hypothetical protein